MAFSKWIRHLRLQKNWQAKELATNAGVSASTVTRIEKGSIDPTLETVMLLLYALDASKQTLYQIVTDKSLATARQSNQREPEALIAPTLRDAIDFNKYAGENPKQLLHIFSLWLNQIYKSTLSSEQSNALTELGMTAQPFNAETVLLLLTSSPIHRYLLKYPRSITAKTVLQIHRQNGAFMPKDFSVYLQTALRGVEDTKLSKYKLSRYGGFNSSASTTKLSDLVALNAFSQINGEIFFMGLAAAEFEIFFNPTKTNVPRYLLAAKQSFGLKHPAKWGYLLVLIRRWQAHLNIATLPWKEEMEALNISSSTGDAEPM